MLKQSLCNICTYSNPLAILEQQAGVRSMPVGFAGSREMGLRSTASVSGGMLFTVLGLR